MTSSVGIFWDYENCSPAGYFSTNKISGVDIVKNIRAIAHTYGVVKVFKAYAEQRDSTRPTTLRSELQSSGVSLTDCPHNGKKNVADMMMIVDMMVFAADFPQPSTIIVITADRDFAYAVSTLRLRRHDIVVIAPFSQGSSLACQATSYHDWDTEVLCKSVRNQSHTRTKSADVTFSQPSAGSLNTGATPFYPIFGNFGSRPKPSPASSDNTLVDEPSVSGGVPSADESSAFCTPRSEVSFLSSPNGSPDLVVPGANDTGDTEPADAASGSPLTPQSTVSPLGFNSSLPTSLSQWGATTPNAVKSPLPAQTVSLSNDTRDIEPPVSSTSTSVPGADARFVSAASPFHNLISLLQVTRAQGVDKPRMSVIAQQMSNKERDMRTLNVEKFSQFCLVAQQEGVISIGGPKGEEWIKLRPSFHHTPLGKTIDGFKVEHPKFRRLIDMLDEYHTTGCERVERSVIAEQLLHRYGSRVFVDAGFTGWKMYGEEARSLGIVMYENQLGGGHTWIRLDPSWYVPNAVSGWE